MRVPRDEEIAGLDIADLGVEGYPEYSMNWATSAINAQQHSETVAGRLEPQPEMQE